MAELKHDMIVFWRKFGLLLSSGVPVLRALNVIADETANPELQAAVRGLGAAIEAGKTLQEATEQAPQFFSLSVRTLIRTGELTGRLDQAIGDIAKGLDEGSLPCGVAAEKPVAISESAPAAAAGEPAGVSQEDVPVIKLASMIIYQAFRDRASDLHIETAENGKGHIRMRVDGVLYEMAPPPPHIFPALVNRFKIMANLNLAEKRLPQDGRIVVKVEGKELDLRVSTFPCIWGESICLRLLSRSTSLVSLEAVDFTPAQLTQVRTWLRRPSGLILLTGPTGCGKTTTLYGMLQELNRCEVKILTLEDPVEYAIDGLNQLPVRPHIGLTFAAGLRAALRQAPDIVMVSEIRDCETAQIIVQGVLTGHLVLSSLHTNDACGAVARLVDIGLEPFLVGATLAGVCAQRLVRRICPDCRQEAKPKPWMAEMLAAHPGLKLYEGRGCEGCRKTGYKGRVAIHELLELDDSLRKLVTRDLDLAGFRAQARRQGLVPLLEDGLAKVNAGVTTLDEVMHVCAGM